MPKDTAPADTVAGRPIEAGEAGAVLSDRQCRFVEEYLIDLNATQAAARAGYNPRGGWLLLKRPAVRAAVAAAMAARSRRTEITADRVLDEYARIAFADPRRFVSWDGGGVTLRPSADLTDDEAGAVAEVVDGGRGAARVKLYDKITALAAIARHLGLFDARGRTPEDGHDTLSDDERVARIARILDGARARGAGPAADE